MIFFIDNNFVSNYPPDKQSDVKRALKNLFYADIYFGHKVMFDKINTINNLMVLFGNKEDDTYIFLHHCKENFSTEGVLPPYITQIFKICSKSDKKQSETKEGIEYSLVEYTHFVENNFLTRVRDNEIQLGAITVRHEFSGGQSLGA